MIRLSNTRSGRKLRLKSLPISSGHAGLVRREVNRVDHDIVGSEQYLCYASYGSSTTWSGFSSFIRCYLSSAFKPPRAAPSLRNWRRLGPALPTHLTTPMVGTLPGVGNSKTLPAYQWSNLLVLHRYLCRVGALGFLLYRAGLLDRHEICGLGLLIHATFRLVCTYYYVGSPDFQIVANLKALEIGWLNYSFRKAEQPPKLVQLVLGKSPVLYDWLRSGRLGPLVTSVFSVRKILAFTTQDLVVELPSQFGDIIHQVTASAADAVREFSASLVPILVELRGLDRGQRVGGSLRNISRSFRQAASFTRFPDKAFPMLWTSSYSGPRAWKNLGVDYLSKAAQTLIEVSHKRVPWSSGLVYAKPTTITEHPCVVNVDGKPVVGKSIMGVPTGRLSLLREFGGKIRAFAIPSTLTQYALKPIHDAVFRLIATFPSDFTFDQNRFRRLVVSGFYDHRPAWCYDLTSATDRFPILLQSSLLNGVFSGIRYSSEIGIQLLGDLWRDCIQDGPWEYTRGDMVKLFFEYTAQPMGAFSSWGVFSLSHHILVLTLGRSLGLSYAELFRSYAIVGDDIVLFNEALADKYISTLRRLSIPISMSKSIIPTRNENGWTPGIDFLAKWYVNGRELSRLPIQVLASGHPAASECFSAEVIFRLINVWIQGSRFSNARTMSSLLNLMGGDEDHVIEGFHRQSLALQILSMAGFELKLARCKKVTLVLPALIDPVSGEQVLPISKVLLNPGTKVNLPFSKSALRYGPAIIRGKGMVVQTYQHSLGVFALTLPNLPTPGYFLQFYRCVLQLFSRTTLRAGVDERLEEHYASLIDSLEIERLRSVWEAKHGMSYVEASEGLTRDPIAGHAGIEYLGLPFVNPVADYTAPPRSLESMDATLFAWRLAPVSSVDEHYIGGGPDAECIWLPLEQMELVFDFISAASSNQKFAVGHGLTVRPGCFISSTTNFLSAPVKLSSAFDTLRSLEEEDPEDTCTWISIILNGHSNANRRLSRAVMYPGVKIRSETMAKVYSSFRTTRLGAIRVLAGHSGTWIPTINNKVVSVHCDYLPTSVLSQNILDGKLKLIPAGISFPAWQFRGRLGWYLDVLFKALVLVVLAWIHFSPIMAAIAPVFLAELSSDMCSCSGSSRASFSPNDDLPPVVGDSERNAMGWECVGVAMLFTCCLIVVLLPCDLSLGGYWDTSYWDGR